MFITVYYSVRKIRITTGNKLSNKVTDSVKDSIIYKMEEYLKRDDFNEAFSVAVDDSLLTFTSSFSYVGDYVEGFLLT